MAVNPNDYLVAYLKFDESTTKDECGNTWTAYNNPTISTTNAVYGGKALQLTGTNYIEISNGLNLGGQDFTIDGWFYIPSTNSGNTRGFELSTGAGNDTYLLMVSLAGISNKLIQAYGMRGSLFITATAPTVMAHSALVYVHSTTTIMFFVNGVKVGSKILNVPRNNYLNLRLGRSSFSDNTWLKGSIDEFRVYDGLARWTSDFTPPDASDYITEFDTSFELGTSRVIVRTEGLSLATTRQIANVTNLELATERKLANVIGLEVATNRQLMNKTELEVGTKRKLYSRLWYPGSDGIDSAKIFAPENSSDKLNVISNGEVYQANLSNSSSSKLKTAKGGIACFVG